MAASCLSDERVAAATAAQFLRYSCQGEAAAGTSYCFRYSSAGAERSEYIASERDAVTA